MRIIKLLIPVIVCFLVIGGLAYLLEVVMEDNYGIMGTIGIVVGGVIVGAFVRDKLNKEK